MHHKGIFIAMEGIDGSGKSTQIKLLQEKLEKAQYKVYSTFEPTDNKIGSLLRSIIKGEHKADNRTIAALFAADRLHHILNEKDGILKKLEEGYVVLSDRYYFSSYAYHSVYMDMEWVIEINKKSAELLRPNMNIYIDIEASQAMERIQQNRKQTDLYESMEMLNAVRNNYEKAFALMSNSENIIRIAGNADSETIASNIWDVVKPIL